MKKKFQILIHCIYWLHSIFWDKITAVFYNPDKPVNWGNIVNPLSASFYFLAGSTFYINYFFVLPKFLRKRKYFSLLLLWLALVILFIGARYSIEEVFFANVFGFHNYSDGTSFLYYMIDNIYFGGIQVVMSTVIWSVIEFVKNEKEKNELIIERNNAELSFLKSQVNPHFLFNTLNNIYSLVYHQSEQALPAIMKLSALMRYMTMDSTKSYISIKKELEYIYSFIELESLRTAGEVEISSHIKVDDAEILIAPLMLIPFIENGFKHGVMNDKDNPFFIELVLNDKQLLLRTRNKINRHQKGAGGGIGLANVRRRLELLYPEKYSLEIQNDHEIYICKLELNLQQ